MVEKEENKWTRHDTTKRTNVWWCNQNKQKLRLMLPILAFWGTIFCLFQQLN